jgi:hypothetical protein
MAPDNLENANPTIYRQTEKREVTEEEEDNDVVDQIDSREVFGILWSTTSFRVVNTGPN